MSIEELAPGGAPEGAGEIATVRDEVEVRRNAGLHGVVGVVGAVLAIAYVVRASASSGTTDWLLALAMAIVAVVALVGLVDAQTPLLVADETGVRIRLGREWRGLPWGALAQVVVENRDSVLRDGRLVLTPRDAEAALADLDRGSRRHLALLRHWYGAPLTVPLALTTRSSTRTLAADLRTLAAGRSEVVELRGRDLAVLEETERHERHERPAPAEHSVAAEQAAPVDLDHDPAPHHGPHGRLVEQLGELVSRIGRGRAHDVDAEEAPLPEPVVDPLPEPEDGPVLGEVPEVRTPTYVEPLRAARRALRADVTREEPAVRLPAGVVPAQDIGPDARGYVSDAEPSAEGTGPAVVLGAEEPAAPVADPVIGPELAAARERAGLTVDALSERTRIRPHVIEGIEADDFGPCGGDFYARGHLRTLGRFLGLDQDALVAAYDEHYAHAPINARRVFEAELATGMSGGIRGTVGGPRWSLLVGAALCLLMVWGVARFFSDPAPEVASPSPVVSDSAGLAANNKSITSPLTTTTALTLSALRADAAVTVKDHTGTVIWQGTLHTGDTEKIAGVAPFTVTASNAGSVALVLHGQHLGRVGAPGHSATRKVG